MKSYTKLPIVFDKVRLLSDLNSAKQEWIEHFNNQYYNGEWSGIPLIEPVDKNHDLSPGSNFEASYQNTSLLDNLKYFKHVLSYFKCNKTSARLLKLAAGSEIKSHIDPELSYFNGHIRIHIPIVTNNDVIFKVDENYLSMLPGECWYADFSKPHSVKNKGETDRIHLVVDLEINNWLNNLFICQGILGKNEKKPDPVKSMSYAEKLQMIDSLKLLNTTASIKIVKELESNL